MSGSPPSGTIDSAAHPGPQPTVSLPQTATLAGCNTNERKPLWTRNSLSMYLI